MFRHPAIVCLLLMLCVAPALAQNDNITLPPQPNLDAPVNNIPISTYPMEDITGEVYFSSLQQGEVGLVRVVGEGISEALAFLRDKTYPFIEVSGDAWYALVVADIDAQPREYVLSVLIQRSDGRIHAFDAPLLIEGAGYIRQNFAVEGQLAYLADPVVERQEFARLDAMREGMTPEPLWDADGFNLPIEAEFTAVFGNYRILNQNTQTRHTGWDQRAVPGTPVAAMASGRVVFAGRLDIRGNYVMLDHGWGIYSGYAHFSQLNVERGQTVAAGQIIGLSGNTGRSIGPHLHWEISVHGEWVDGVAFLRLWLPTTA